MANVSITLEGIDEAIGNLNYREGSVKQKAILAIRAFYSSEQSIKELSFIDTDTLIKSIWDTADTLPKIKAKRRNYSSIKSSINADLAKLSKKGLNSENLILADTNIFDMTEEAKSNLISSFTDAVKTGDIDLDQASSLLKTVTEFLENFQADGKESDAKDIVNQIKKILNKITEDVLPEETPESTTGQKKLKTGDLKLDEDGDGQEEETTEDAEEGGEEEEKTGPGENEALEEVDENIETIELDEDEELETIDDDVEEIEIGDDEELEEIDELGPDADLEEAEELDEDVEVIELDQDEEIEELDEGFGTGDGDADQIELEEDEELEEVDESFGDGEGDADQIELDEDEVLEEVDELGDDFEEIDAQSDIEEIQLDEDEELEEIDELGPDVDIEEIEDLDEEIETIELDEDEELETIDEDLEEIELDQDEELEEVDELDPDVDLEAIEDLDEDIETIELDEDEEIETIDDDVEEIEIGEDEEIEELDEGFGTGDGDVEEIELGEDEELEEVDEGFGDGDGDAGDEDAEEVELTEDEELEEIEELDEDELKALEEFRKIRELAEHFDNALGEREKKYNKYVIVPEGDFTIGTKKSLKSSLELQLFHMPKVYIGIYPVNNSLFEIFIEETGYVTTAEKSGFGRVYYSRYKKDQKGSTWNKNAGSEDVKGACWHKPTGPGSSLHGKRNHPVVQVSVDDAAAFASWIGRRLPTESEWEAAARTDLGNKYPWGNTFNIKALNIEKSGTADTSDVDEYDAFANEFKIIDMLGNVMEWTSDMETPAIKSMKNTRFCIAKGAAWNAGNNVTISSRGLFKPGFTSNTIGFRCISEVLL